jgi:hypothetical protein
VVEHAHPQREAAPQAGRGDQALPAGGQPFDQALVQSLQAVLVHPFGPPTETDDPKLCWRQQLELRAGLDAGLGEQGQVDRAVDRRPERLHAKVLQRHPQLQGPGGARQLHPEIREVDLQLSGLGVLR